MQDWSSIGKGINRISRTLNRGISDKSKKIKKGINKLSKEAENSINSWANMSTSITNEISQEGRVPVNAELRKKILAEFNHKCHNFSKCGIDESSGILQIHHIDMINHHTDFDNLELLCPNHHMFRHRDYFRRKYTSGSTRLIKKRV
jgi:predicted restriction endonuclease